MQAFPGSSLAALCHFGHEAVTVNSTDRPIPEETNGEAMPRVANVNAPTRFAHGNGSLASVNLIPENVKMEAVIEQQRPAHDAQRRRDHHVSSQSLWPLRKLPEDEVGRDALF